MQRLKPFHWIFALAALTASIAIVEVIKFFYRKRHLKARSLALKSSTEGSIDVQAPQLHWNPLESPEFESDSRRSGSIGPSIHVRWSYFHAPT